jgi:2-dehydro-3-deoxy-D-gluconate 5-dehydrogenase
VIVRGDHAGSASTAVSVGDAMTTTAPFDLTGKVALVTGGNGGIGLGMAKGLAGAGCAIMVAGRDAEKSKAAAAELAAMGVRTATCEGDIAKPETAARIMAATIAHFGRLDILVANAGINVRKQPQDYTPAEWQSVLDTNLNGPFFCAQAAYPIMKAAGGGKIITIGSMTSIFGLPFAPAYSATKGGIVQMTRALAVAWAADNIQVNAVLPGWIDTNLTKSARAQVPDLHDRVLARTPAARWGKPADFGGIAVFLASPASDFMTGTAIPVDGGFSISG